jgi:hypothetical protein
MNRRHFLKLLALLGVNLEFHTSAHAADAKVVNIYIDESGIPSHDGFALGFLYVNNSRSVKLAFSKFRKDAKFKLQFRQRSNNKFKKRFVKKVLDYFVSSGELSFKAWIINKGVRDESKYASLYKDGILRGKKMGDQAIVYYVKRSQNGKRDRRMIDFVIGNDEKIEFRQIKNKNYDDLFQLTDLLTGSIRCARVEKKYVSDKVKLATISQIEKTFGIPNLSRFEGNAAKRFDVTVI